MRPSFKFCECFLESNSPEILALCETNLDDPIDSGSFSVRVYLPLIWKDSTTHLHGLEVYIKEELPFAHNLSLENSADCYLCFRLALLHSVSYSFSLCRSRSPSLCMVFDSISSNIDEHLLINLSANIFFFGDFNVIIRTELPVLVELIDLVNSVIIFLSQMTLLKWLTFLLGFQTAMVLLFSILTSYASICSTILSLHGEILIMLLSQFPLTFHQIVNGMPRFIA